MITPQFTTDSTHPGLSPDRANQPWPVAVVDIGASSLRMQISEIHPGGGIRKLESFSQAVSIGKDSFSAGKILRGTIEDCVHVLRIYRMKLAEYGINEKSQLRVIATSGVKEASNRLAFVDRIFVATGLHVELLDEAELHRVTFVGALPIIESNPEIFSEPAIICEISGGTTEVLIFKDTEVLFSQSYRQGAMRIRKALQSLSGRLIGSRNLFEAQFNRMVGVISHQAKKFGLKNLLAVGGDIRFAAAQILGDSAHEDLSTITLDQLGELTNEILSESIERLVSKYHLSFPDAGSLGPALLAYHYIAQELGLNKLFVANFNLRDGIIEEMALGGKWSDSVERQTIRSAVQLGQKFKIDEAHGVHVSNLACILFEQLADLHQLDSRFMVILEMAAILHEVGLLVSTRSYHKHSLYVISNSEFFGISAKDVQLVALVARYHRRATPQPNHELYSKLDRKDRVLVTKLAALLRIAKALDASRSQCITEIECTRRGNDVVIRVDDATDISVEQLEMKKSGQLFADIFGTELLLETTGV